MTSHGSSMVHTCYNSISRCDSISWEHFNCTTSVSTFVSKHAIRVRFDWLCLSPKWVISHGNNKFNSCIRWNNNGVRFILDTLLDLHTAILLTLQRSVSRHDVIILLFWFRDNQSLILLYKVECLAEMQQIHILQFWFDPIGTGTHDLPHLRRTW